MAFDFIFPDVGEGITEGTIVKWKKKVGDKVKADEPIAEVETDKAIVDIPSPKAGTLLEIDHQEGDTIKVGEVLAVIGEKGEKSAKKKSAKSGKKKSKSKKKSGKKKDEHYTGSVVGFLEEAEDKEDSGKKAVRKKRKKRVRATFKVRKLAKKLGVNIKEVEGTGHQGRITEKDVEHAAKKEDAPGEELKGVRKAIAKNLSESYSTAVHVTNFHDADVTELWELRKKEKKKAEKKKIHLTFLPYVIKAVVAALKDHPVINSSLQHGKLHKKDFYNIGIAVDTDDGLIVPVLKEADKKKLLDMAKELSELGEKARKRKLGMEEIKEGTFTITNLGSVGVKYFTPIINYPEAAILGTGRISEQAVVMDGKVEVRKVMPLSFTYDHRIIDGANAARFMQDVIKLLENPQDI